jgi:sterol 3beta-glucosyltransferase
VVFLKPSANVIQENGVETAIQAIYRDMEYAKSLIKRTKSAKETAEGEDDGDADGLTWEDVEESWTFIGDEADEDLRGRIRDFDMSRRPGKGRDTAASSARQSIEV